MESQSQNLEFRINPENFHPCVQACKHTHGPAQDSLVLDKNFYVPSTIFQLNRNGSSLVEPVLS